MSSAIQADEKPYWKRTLVITAVAHFVAAMGFSSTFPFLPLYVEKLGSVTMLGVGMLSGLVYSCQAFTMMIASPFWGNLADRYGRKIMVERAMFGGAAIIALMGFVRNAEELVLLKTIQGFITGVIAANNAMVAAVTPRQYMGRSMGILQIAMGGGIAVGPLIGGLVADWWGYEMAFWVTAGSLFMAGVLVWVGVHEDFDPALAPDKATSFWGGWRAVMQNEGLTMVYTLRFASVMGRSMAMPLTPLLVVELMGKIPNVNSFTGLVFGIGSAFFALSAAYVAKSGDRIGSRLILWVSLLVSAIAFTLHGFVTEGWHVLTLQVGVGAAMGGIMPSIGALQAHYSQAGQEGKVYGLDNSVMSGARTVGPMLAVSCAAWIGIKETFIFIGLVSLATAFLAAKKLPRPKREPANTASCRS